jgi:hypothetical protein
MIHLPAPESKAGHDRGRTTNRFENSFSNMSYPESAMPISPTTEGFRAAFRRPSLALAEISWRWTVGATAAALCVFGLFEYLDTLPVTNGELLFLRTRQPYLVGEAIAHILRGSLNRAVMAALLAALMVAGLWIIAAALGRIATVRGLLDYFRRDVARNVSADDAANDGERDTASNVSPLRALARLNFLRVAVALAALLGLVGASILASFASPDSHPHPALSFFLFLALSALVFLAWSSLNWLLSLAGIFAVRDGEDAVGAISAAVTLCRERAGAVSVVSTWTGLAHLVAFVGTAVVLSMPLGLVALVSWRLVIAITVLATLVYFALADWLYTARMAGYVCLIEMPEALLTPLPLVSPPAPPTEGTQPGPPLQTTIDHDETILSDLPGPVVSGLA